MKFDEALKLKNFKEHYSIVLGNVHIANAELERVLGDKVNVVNEIEKSTETIFVLSKKIEELISNRDQIIKETDSRIKEISDSETSLLKLSEDTKNYVDNSKIELEQVKSSLARDIQVLRESVLELIETESTMGKSVSVISQQVSTMSNEARVLSEQVHELNKQKGILLQEIDELTVAHTQAVEKNIEELEHIMKKKEEESDKITLADVYIKRKEKDIAVITRRLQSLYAEILPGTTLKI